MFVCIKREFLPHLLTHFSDTTSGSKTFKKNFQSAPSLQGSAKKQFFLVVIVKSCFLGNGNLKGILTLLHSERPKLMEFGHSECNRVKTGKGQTDVVSTQCFKAFSRKDHLKNYILNKHTDKK